MPLKMSQAKNIRGDAPARPVKPTADERGYGHVHRTMRLTLLRCTPLCQHRGQNCTGFSEEAHHLVWPAVELKDYLAVCKACHVELEREKREGR